MDNREKKERKVYVPPKVVRIRRVISCGGHKV